MLYRKLGSSGIDVSAVGFGAWAIGGWMWGGADENQAIAAIHAALDHGINLLDTAPIYGYGRSEEIVGRAIRGRREKVVLATKCGMIWDREEGEFFFHANQEGITFRPSEKKVYKCLRPDSIRAELERSLTRLGTTHVDLYQTHWQESTTPIADTMAALVKLKEQGKIRAHWGLERQPGTVEGLRPDRLGPGKIQHARPQPRNQRHVGVLPPAEHRRVGVLAAGQRAVDRQDSSRPPVRAGRLAQGQSPLHAGQHRAGQRHAGTTPSDRRAAPGDHRATGDRLDAAAAGHDLRVVRRPRPAAGDRKRRRRRSCPIARRIGDDRQAGTCVQRISGGDCMTEPSTAGKIPLTLHLTADVAARLKLAAETQRRPAADLAADLLDRYLPRPPSSGPKKGSIPYS